LLYQNKVIELRNSLDQATKQIEAMTSEYVKMKDEEGEKNEMMEAMKGENEKLAAMLEEIYAKKREEDNDEEKIRTQVLKSGR